MIVIKINEKYGSEFQEDFARESLFNMLDAWLRFVNFNHKKNNITIEIEKQIYKNPKLK